MELKVRVIIFFGSIILHCECIVAPFAVFSWYLIEHLDTEAVTCDVRLNKRIKVKYESLSEFLSLCSTCSSAFCSEGS